LLLFFFAFFLVAMDLFSLFHSAWNFATVFCCN